MSIKNRIKKLEETGNSRFIFVKAQRLDINGHKLDGCGKNEKVQALGFKTYGQRHTVNRLPGEEYSAFMKRGGAEGQTWAQEKHPGAFVIYAA